MPQYVVFLPQYLLQDCADQTYAYAYGLSQYVFVVEVDSTCILNIITLVPSIVLFAPSLFVGSGARVFVAKSDPFCALQACMDGSM